MLGASNQVVESASSGEARDEDSSEEDFTSLDQEDVNKAWHKYMALIYGNKVLG